MSHLLKYRNPYGEIHYLLNLGDQWPSRPALRLIERTTTTRSEARVFDTEDEAREVLVTSGNEPVKEDGQTAGWRIEEAGP